MTIELQKSRVACYSDNIDREDGRTHPENSSLLANRLGVSLLISSLIRAGGRIGRLVPRLEGLRAHEALLLRRGVILGTGDLWLPSLSDGHRPLADGACPDALRLERYHGYEEEREPRAGLCGLYGSIVASGTYAGSEVPVRFDCGLASH